MVPFHSLLHRAVAGFAVVGELTSQACAPFAFGRQKFGQIYLHIVIGNEQYRKQQVFQRLQNPRRL